MKPIRGRFARHLVLCAAGSSAVLGPHSAALAESDDDPAADRADIPTITVKAQRVANDEPANLFATIATRLRYDPEIDLQFRGSAEAQADISIRGGVFENTGVAVGAIAVFDPQTGHYTAGLPIDPAVLSMPNPLTDSAHAMAGFNSTVATLAYAWRPMLGYREITLGGGTDALRSGAFGAAGLVTHDDLGATGIEARYALSEGDGSRDNGDHRFERALLRVQHRRNRSQTDLAIAYQDSFFGWPGAYTGFAALPETDHTKTALLIANHRMEYQQDERGAAFVELAAYYRDVEDDYDFDRRSRESDVPGSFDHRTRSYAVGLQGRHAVSPWALRYGLQLSGDELVRSTDLTFGDFDSRRYLKATVAPEYRWTPKAGVGVSLQFGATFDASNRDGDELLPMASVSMLRTHPSGSDEWAVSYVATSQVPGYTALNSAPQGLFGGNSALGRERAESLVLRYGRDRSNWRAELLAFRRIDDQLVDWTFLSGAPFVRQANAVDLDVTGFEALLVREWSAAGLTVSYAYLDKDANYGPVPVDASYYALNYARHRVTAALRYHLGASVTVHVDNEYRRQIRNPLRTNGGDAYVGSLAIEWRSLSIQRLGLTLVVDNLTNNDFEEFPGTPAPRRQASLKLRYRW